MAKLEQYLIRHYDKIDSTQEEAKRLVSSGQAKEGLVLVAKEQTNAHGKHNKPWLTNKSDLGFTIILRPDKDIKTLGQICYITAIAVGQSLQNLDQKLHIQFKWVNDILISDKKVGGVLLEEAEHGFLLIGVGINIINSKHLAQFDATSLESHNVTCDNDKLVDSIISYFISSYNLWLDMGFSPIKTQWIRKAKGLKSSIKVNIANKIIEGIFIGIDDDDGSLLIVSGSELKSITAGDVFFLDSNNTSTI